MCGLPHILLYGVLEDIFLQIELFAIYYIVFILLYVWKSTLFGNKKKTNGYKHIDEFLLQI